MSTLLTVGGGRGSLRLPLSRSVLIQSKLRLKHNNGVNIGHVWLCSILHTNSAASALHKQDTRDQHQVDGSGVVVATAYRKQRHDDLADQSFEQFDANSDHFKEDRATGYHNA